MTITIDHLSMLPKTAVKVTELPSGASNCGFAISEPL